MMKMHFGVTHTSHFGSFTRAVCGAGETATFTEISKNPEKITCGSCKRSPKWRAAMERKTGKTPSTDRPWRGIHRRDTTWSEQMTETSRSFSWNATYEHKLTLECGHTQIRRGYSDPPKHRAICKDCETGEEGPGVEGVEPGIFDRTRTERPKGSVVVDALIGGRDYSQEAMRERAKRRSPNYASMSAEEQWAEDKRLGILDYEGQ